MRDRREHQRFELLFRHEGLLRLLSAVELVSLDNEDVVVIADHAGYPGEPFVFRGPPPDEQPRDVRVASCRPLLEGDRVRYEVRLVLDEARGEVRVEA